VISAPCGAGNDPFRFIKTGGFDLRHFPGNPFYKIFIHKPCLTGKYNEKAFGFLFQLFDIDRLNKEADLPFSGFKIPV
jgi:hypothetical protein